MSLFSGIFSSVLGGAASLLGGRMNNAANASQSQAANNFTAEQGQITRDFNAQQAQIMRDFNSSEADENRQFNSAEAVFNRDFQAHQAQVNRDYQTEMANTSYQRGMADMKAAGLNPMLAYLKGGAVAPSGSMASGSQASGSAASSSAASSSPGSGQRAQMNDVITPAINSALQLQRNNAEVELVNAQRDKVRAETTTELNRPENVKANTWAQQNQGDLAYTERQVAFQRIANVLEDTNLKQNQNKLTIQQIDQAIAQTRLIGEQAKQTISSAITLMKQGDLYEAQAKLAQLQQSEAGATAAFYDNTGQTSKVMELAKTLSILIKSMR